MYTPSSAFSISLSDPFPVSNADPAEPCATNAWVAKADSPYYHDTSQACSTDGHSPRPLSTIDPGCTTPTKPFHAGLVKLADAFLYIQMLWVSLAGLLVYMSYLLGLSPVLTWISLALACLPFLLRMARNGIRSLRTPFDLPIVLFLAGALIGFCVSDNRAISLGALQCILAVTLFYYSWVNSPRFAGLIKPGIMLLALGFLILLVFFWSVCIST